MDASTVYLVGAGPGDPELLTVKARRLLDEADVVVYDRLVSEAVLALIPPGTARISVGKQPRDHPVPQSEISRLLVGLARHGRTVVRLKGGDPFIFGRGSEEAAVLAAHGIRFEVVPGITSASGCAAAIGVPLTHRGLASGVRFVTGHCRSDMELGLDWRGLADPDTTLVVYMAMANIDRIAKRLIAHGLAESTPAAAINNGTRPEQRHVISTLGQVAQRAAAAGFAGPVLFVVGRVVALGDVLAGQARDPEAEQRAGLA
ncbi:MAG: uroporphyrinogen-III C-methyltransferase [Gemmatimonadetes bacterium]|uniref:uroporphyrinogen-III C-methyltransferase n=1 Tax=Candidatus Kutchimonas denitrificans TaxID=3056748 RepID=A0AAE4ZC47_9BACT|nr:uroporphyrinogen-III C-methyltransferase [Candidatus Kutchimonas denitrificans]NIS01224.1 uroporphyrinogen-III C-methyltransferase [Gemmatimonadota bacterium]NIW38891.1 uroporphyrinogen-III C-methyltransferase [Gemmatimonadota bacterium]NIY43632.1 uroporphyrinogen-III C-methyltransferase [Gemmatimonadota bacterium]